MKPIRIRIRRKVQVRTKKQLVHKYRSDWILVGIIDYGHSSKIFKNVDENAPITTEEEFAYFLHKNYGPGIYSCIAWIRGIGNGKFFGFWKGELTNDGFKRLPVSETAEMRENKQFKNEVKGLKKQLNNEETPKEEKQKIQTEIDDIRADFGLNAEILDLEKKGKRGIGGYLKSAIPVYKFHGYERYDKKQNTTEVNKLDFW